MTWKSGTHVDSPRAAEEMAARHMKLALGINDARRTPTGPDGGIDVRSRTAIAQVKRHAALTGRPDLQRLVGARGKKTDLTLLFYSAAGYSQHAAEYADEMDIALFVYTIDGVVRPENRAAKRLMRPAPTVGRTLKPTRVKVEWSEEERAALAQNPAVLRAQRNGSTVSEPHSTWGCLTFIVAPLAIYILMLRLLSDDPWSVGQVALVPLLVFLIGAAVRSAVGRAALKRKRRTAMASDTSAPDLVVSGDAEHAWPGRRV